MKKLYKSFNTILLLLTLLTFGATSAWGKRMTGTVSVAQGKGTVQVEVWTVNAFSSDTKNAEAETSSSKQVTATFDKKATTKYCRFWVKSLEPGYSFVAWYTNEACTAGEKKNAKNKDYYDTDGALASDKSYTYYAKFTANTYAITLKKYNGESDGAVSVKFDSNQNLTTNVSIPSKTGYTFGGYYTGENGTGTQRITAAGAWVAASGFIVDGKWKNVGDVTLHAKWTAKTYTVSFNSHGGTAKDNTTVTYDATYGASTNWPADPTRTGYTFNGWFTAENGGNQVTPSTKVQITSAQTLHAQWTANTYTVSFNSHGGSSVANKTVTYDATYGTLTNPTRAGYTFNGWFTAATGGTQVTSSTKVQITSAQTLHAQWTVNNYTITLNKQNGESNETIDVTYDSNNNLTSSVTKPTKENCTFEGFRTETNGGTLIIDKEGNVIAGVTGYTDADKKWIHADDVTLYAYWKGNQTITWALEENQEYVSGTQMGATATSELPVSYASNHQEWGYIDENGNLQVVVANKEIVITASQSGNGNWNAAPNVTKTIITCGARPNVFTGVSATNLTYGQLLSESTLSGTVYFNETEVAGTLAWVSPETMPNAGNGQSFQVRFTPENTDTYSPVTFNVTINVAKANPVITWNIGTLLRENTVYSNFVTSDNTEAELNISSNSALLQITGQVLQTGSVNNTVNNLRITVSQNASTNYNALAATDLYVSVTPKANVCLPISPLTESTFGDARYASSGNVNWCNTDSEGSAKWAGFYNVSFTQRVGIAIGSWDGGLNYDAKSVDIAFTGVPDRISFSTTLQSVTTSAHVHWPTTGGYAQVYESADGSNYTQVGSDFDANDASFEHALSENTRFVRLEYWGNFTCFFQNVTITQKKYLNSDKSSLTFGTNEHPLQDPQTVTISYSSLGTCDVQNGAIEVTSTNPAFYVDETSITSNVGIDQKGEFTVRVRCNDVYKNGKLTFTAYDGTSTEVTLNSTKPELTSAGSTIFKTGTEHAPSMGAAYRAEATVNYTKAFAAGQAIFDTLYIYGVTESSAAERLWDYDASKGYNVPAINVAEGNLYTPCFVYAKNNNKYEYARTCDATKTLNINAAGKKIGFVGYRPANMATTANAIQLNGAAAEQTELYLDNTEIVANGVVLKTNSSGAVDPFTVKLYARGTNTLTANAAAVQMSAASTKLQIEDNWAEATSGTIVLAPAAGYPSVDLAGANNVTINGSIVELHNATNMAVAHMDGATELTDGSVKINDGTIIGEATLGMPLNTIIDGGTFNDGNVVCYKTASKVVRPTNSNKELLARTTMTYDQLPDWYGKAHLTLDGASKVNPMLLDANLCIFNANEGNQSETNGNWTVLPSAGRDAIINDNMVVTKDLKVNSLTIKEGVTVTVQEGVMVIVGNGDSFYEKAGNLHVQNKANVVLNNGILKVKNFCLDAALGDDMHHAKSGQLENPNQLNINGDAYFQMDFDPAGRISYGWYDFTVPFEVNINGGLERVNSSADKVMVSGVDFIIMEADEQNRANGGKGWRTLNGGVLKPGKLYTITLEETIDHNTVRFMWNGNGNLNNSASYNAIYATGNGSNNLYGWNGMGNGTLHHAYIGGSYKMQAYNHSTNTYELVDEAKTFAVGSAFFIQVDEPVQVDWTVAEATKDRPLFAPKYEAEEVEEFRLTLRDEQDKKMDALFFSASETATDDYAIGHDLMKMGTMSESKKARMWATKGGKQLCDVEATLVSGSATTPLFFFAPAAGQYELAIDEMPADANLYLTYNDQIIWDLTTSAYTIDLTKGTTSGYGLLVEARAPQITTGVENTTVDGKSARKVLINNTLYIVTPEGKMYDVTGKMAK